MQHSEAAVPPLIIPDPATNDLARRLWQFIDELDAAGHGMAVIHATMAWSLVVGEAVDLPQAPD